MDGDKKSEGHEETTWQYQPGGSHAASPSAASADAADDQSQAGGSVEWSASEFVAHEKSAGWYAVLTVATLVVAAAVYLLTRHLFSTLVVLIMAAALAVSGSRKPRTVPYRLDSKGLTVGTKFYPYNAYKSFVIPEDGPFTSVILTPLKRFAFPISAYLAPDSQHKALELLSDHLPMERSEPDFLERLMRQLRF